MTKTYTNLFQKLYSFENLQDAYEKARKHKTSAPSVQKFDVHWRLQLCILSRELRTKTYRPKPLKIFILCDPKTRKICVSDFHDRIVHHALVNILQPIFEPRFIYDSYASRVGKGTSVALERLQLFLRQVTKNGKLQEGATNNNQVIGYALKVDIYHYFESVDQSILLEIIERKIKDADVLWLVRTILQHYPSKNMGKGMPLGNWTSQFFANVYLNELDQFVKHQLKAKWYIRYVDDFIILEMSREKLQEYDRRIKEFLQTIKLQAHPQKCKIALLSRGLTFLGVCIFYHYKLVRQRNVRKIYCRLNELLNSYEEGVVEADDVLEVFYGWSGYAQLGNSYHLRRRIFRYLEQELKKRTTKRRCVLT